MADSVTFPLFVFEKDDCSMFLVEAPDKVLHRMEPIDIENNEYLYWDAKGKAVRISVEGKRATAIHHDAAEMPLAKAFKRHSDAFGLDVDMTGPADEVWRRLKEAEAQLPPRRGLISRFSELVGRVRLEVSATSTPRIGGTEAQRDLDLPRFTHKTARFLADLDEVTVRASPNASPVVLHFP